MSVIPREAGFSAKLVKGSKFKSKKRYMYRIIITILALGIISLSTTSDTRDAESHEADKLSHHIDILVHLYLL